MRTPCRTSLTTLGTSAERVGVGVVAVQMRQQSCGHARLSGSDLRERDRGQPVSDPREHRRGVLERIDEHPLALGLDLHAGPYEPTHSHLAADLSPVVWKLS